MRWLSEVDESTVRHIIDVRRAIATPLCEGEDGVCVDSEDANCPVCKAVLVR